MTRIVALLVFVPMLVEALRAARNERRQRARGGLEPDGDVYELMRVVYPLSFVVMMLEGAWRGTTPVPLVVGGAVVFATAKVLKWWAILTLGQAWTFRIIVVPGSRLVASGPYRFLRHPNYVGVVGEFVGVLLMTGALVTGPVVTAAFIVLLLRRMVVEERSLRPLDPSTHSGSSRGEWGDDKLRTAPSEAEGRQAHS
jgi:methyltransferase